LHRLEAIGYGPDMDSDASGQTWMTYAQAGERLGLTPEAVRKRANRQRWRRMAGNDGKTLLLVPGQPDGRPTVHPGGRPTARPSEGSEALALLQQAITMLGEQLQAERARSDNERTRASGAEALAAEEREKRESAEQRAAMAEADRDQLLASHNRALLEVEALRAADRARRGTGRLARLRGAWRGE